MRKPQPGDPRPSEITPRALWLGRRALLTGAAAAMALPAFGQSRFSTDESQNSLDEITNYNNFYEFGLDKTDPARNAHRLTTAPWQITIDGLVERPGTYPLEEIIAGQQIEERIYRLRCVEAWSMVIPWQGFELAALLNRVGLQSGARFVSFETVSRPEEMPGMAWRVIDWPYREGLRLDEAMHPLTILATGLYGEALPNQNGAPIRLVVPWKYGFKSIKSITRISVTSEQPYASWEATNPREYGFYANVNPEVDHPRWSQASERRIGDGIFARRRPTEMFNGYGAEVAALYAGMDLRQQY